MDHQVLVWVNFMVLAIFNERCQHFQPQIFHVADAEGAPLNHPDLIVEPFHKSQGDFIVRMTVADDPLPMLLHHLGEFQIRRHAAPFELGLPVLEELTGPRGILVIPELSEFFFEQIRLADALVGFQQQGQRAPSLQIEIRLMRQERVALALDKAPVLLGHSPVLPAPDLIQGIAEMPHHMELVENHPSLRSVSFQRVSERRPHVHDRQPQRPAPLKSHVVEETVHVFFGASQFQTHPDRSLLVEIGHDNGVTMPLADRDLIDPDGPQPQGGLVFGPEIFHVADVHAPDLVPIEPVEFRHFLDRHASALPADKTFVALGKAPRFGQPGQRFPLHAAAPAAIHPAILEFQMDPCTARIQVPDLVSLAVVEATRGLAA
jgi:hypothetical protein